MNTNKTGPNTVNAFSDYSVHVYFHSSLVTSLPLIHKIKWMF